MGLFGGCGFPFGSDSIKTDIEDVLHPAIGVQAEEEQKWGRAKSNHSFEKGYLEFWTD
jgi:hypothetical protein